MNVLRKIVSGVWMVDPASAAAYLPYVARLMAGESVAFPKQDAVLPRMLVARSGEDYPGGETETKREEELIMVYSVRGMITKDDQECGPTGTETLMRHMKLSDMADSVIGHLLEIDSGGGEATNIETVARFIRNEIRKPVIAWYNGVAASAAYYIACACDEVYASEETDEVGSIGAMISFADVRGMWEEKGVKFHEIYADQSDLKNLDYREALQGKYDMLREQFINPYAQRFIDTVREFRPALTQADAYRGKIYMTADAIGLGMIDGTMTYRQAVDRLSEMGREFKQQSNSTQIQSNMSYRKIQSTLGGPLETDKKGGAYLTQEELMLLEEGLVSALPATLESTEHPAIEAVETRLTALEETLTTMSANMENIGAVVAALGKQPGAARTLAATEGDDNGLISSDEAKDALASLEKKANDAAMNGQRIYID